VIRGVKTKTFKIENTGNGVLSFTGDPKIEISGSNADNFEIAVQPTANLQPNTSLTFVVRFDPSSFGEKNATITVESNDQDEGTYTFDIKGIGAEPTSSAGCVLSVNNYQLNVPSGTYLNVQHLHYFGSSTISNEGNIVVAGDWTNQKSTTLTGNGTYDVKSSGGQQNISPNGASIKKVVIENNDDVILESNGTIENLTLTNGDLDIGDYTLTLTGSATGGNSSSYIKISGEGRVVKEVGSGPITIPIGRNPYLPIIISNGGDANFTVGVYNDVYDNPITENTVQTEYAVSETWTIQSDQAVDDVVIQIGWDSGEELNNFDRAKSTVAYWQSGVSSSWTNSGTFNTASGSGPYFQSITLDFTTNLYYFGVGSAGSPLPIELGNFSVNWINEGDEALIEWTTLSEINNSHFIVEKSYDGQNFFELDRVEGAGNTVEERYYSLNDFEFSENEPVIYYRLKQVDFDGTFSYSQVKTLMFGESATGEFIAVYPNPASSKLIVDAPIEGKSFNYSIYALDGKQIQKGKSNRLVDLSQISDGQYLIEIIAGDKVSKQLIQIIH
jgi:hypothetical protein